MYGAGDQFLAGPRLAQDQHARIRRRDNGHQRQRGLQGRALAHDRPKLSANFLLEVEPPLRFLSRSPIAFSYSKAFSIAIATCLPTCSRKSTSSLSNALSDHYRAASTPTTPPLLPVSGRSHPETRPADRTMERNDRAVGKEAARFRVVQGSQPQPAAIAIRQQQGAKIASRYGFGTSCGGDSAAEFIARTSGLDCRVGMTAR